MAYQRFKKDYSFKRKVSEGVEESTDDPEYFIFEGQLLAKKGIRAITTTKNEVTFHYPYSQTVVVSIPEDEISKSVQLLYKALEGFDVVMSDKLSDVKKDRLGGVLRF